MVELVTAIHFYSDMNPWMECVFIVGDNDAFRALRVLDRAAEKWFYDECNVPYGEWLCGSLEKAGIKYQVFIREDDDDDEEYGY